MRRASVCLVLAGLVASCAPRARVTAPQAPSSLLGEFLDDYGNRFRISPTEWLQGSRERYHIKRWETAGGYLIAQNDSANSSAATLWTRIDWVMLEGMPPYEWAFCLSAYEAPSAAAAESVTIARHATPRNGCNGFPFSRMRKIRHPDASEASGGPALERPSG